jgi:hypothetical protein
MDISQQLAFAVKEEIIRNVLKSHQRILVLGLSGTGKTTCTLRAIHGIGTPCYFSPEQASRHKADTSFPKSFADRTARNSSFRGFSTDTDYRRPDPPSSGSSRGGHAL